MKLVNLTPHVLHLLGQEPQTLLAEVPPSGDVARVKTRRRRRGDVATEDGTNIPVFSVTNAQVKNLPKMRANTIYLVSSFVEQAVSRRADVYAPGKLMRDADGNVIGSVGIKKSGV